MNLPHAGTRSPLSPSANLMNATFLRPTADGDTEPQVIRLHGSAAQLWVAAVLAVGALSFFTIAFA